MPRAMLDDADGTLALLRDSVAQFAQQHGGAKRLREKRDRGDDLDRSLWIEMARAGWIGLLLPAEFGGAALSMREQAVVSEGLGYALIAEPTALLTVFSNSFIADATPSPERRRLAIEVASGRVIASPAWRDPCPGLTGAPVTAELGNGAIVLNGTKHYVDAAQSATDFLVTATSPDGVVLLSVPADSAGLSIAQRQGVDGAAIGTVSFNHCHVEADRLLGRARSADALLQKPLLNARLALAAELAGVASGALEQTIAYAKNRIQFGKPIASFQSIQHRLVEMWIDAELACAAVTRAVERLALRDEREAHLAVLAAKARAGEAALSICRRAVHLYGAMGFTDECDIGLYLKRAINLNATLGQPEQLRLQFVELERAA
jgi:alkylation response protein AidB-like acyl-CoA dehydrogenase